MILTDEDCKDYPETSVFQMWISVVYPDFFAKEYIETAYELAKFCGIDLNIIKDKSVCLNTIEYIYQQKHIGK